MARSIPALVEPSILLWARKSAGLDVPQVARKLGKTFAPEKVLAWEDGTEAPSLAHLRQLATIYHRPLALFFLPEPPTEFAVDKIKDFRKLDTTRAHPYSAELRLEIRKSLERREALLDMLNDMGDAPQQFNLTAELKDDPESVGAHLRAALKITRKQQLAWSAQGYDAFKEVRQAMEALGVLVFQCPVDLAEMRGLAIYLSPYPIILISSKEEFMAPRLFTLLHEAAHLMLHCSAISDGRYEHTQQIEVFANHVAGAALLPMKELEAEYASYQGDYIKAAQYFSKSRRISRETALRRLLIAGRLTNSRYTEITKRWAEEFAAKPPPKKREGPVQRHVVELSRMGTLLPLVALRSYRENRITGAELSEIFSLKLKHLPMVIADLKFPFLSA